MKTVVMALALCAAAGCSTMHHTTCEAEESACLRSDDARGCQAAARQCKADADVLKERRAGSGKQAGYEAWKRERAVGE